MRQMRRWLLAIALIAAGGRSGAAQDDRSAGLFEAVRRDDAAAVRQAVSAGVNPNARDRVGDTPLVIAAKRGAVDVVNALLAAKARPTLRSTYGKSPIGEAATNGHRDVVQILLDSRVPVDYSDADGTTALIAASARGDLDLMRFVLDRRAKVDQPDVSGATPLMRAAANNQLAAMDLLLSRGADLKRFDRFHRTALFYATINAHEAVTRDLLKRGADTKIRDVEGLNAFQSAIETMTAGSTERIDQRIATLKAIQDKFDVDSRDEAKRTALMIAAERGSVPIIRYLLSLKPDINAKDRAGKTALDWADVKMRDDAVAVLKAAGAVSGG